MLVNGDSEHVDSGGEIPLGNVMSGNTRYGMEIAGTAGGVVSFNNFVGQAAFGTTPLSNWAGGIRVTSSNPNFDPGDEYSWNRIRTSLVGGNRGNGIEFLGNAYGAEVTDTAVGTDSSIRRAIPNYGNGIVVGGNASHIAMEASSRRSRRRAAISASTSAPTGSGSCSKATPTTTTCSTPGSDSAAAQPSQPRKNCPTSGAGSCSAVARPTSRSAASATL